MVSDYYRVAPENGPRIVVIGGGHGQSTLLRGLKLYSKNLTAIVAVTDDGGGSGMLRRDLGMLPPGDIRNCMEALASAEPIMTRLMGYRFTEGSLAGQSFGNLLLAALNGIMPSFDQAVAGLSQVLAITGQVLPVTNANQIRRIVGLSGTSLPHRFRMIVDKFGHSPAAMRQAGVAYATEQIVDLISNGVRGVHIYTMNKPDVAAQIAAITEGGESA